jgi:hypothetical protein
MKSSRIAAAAFLVSLGLTSAAFSASGQMTTSSPMVVKQTTPKKTWVKAEVIHADSHSIMVRELASERTIHTFTYDTKIQAKMQQISDKGGYKSGDKVKIQYVPGQEVALKIHGKPSKSP